MDPTADPTAFVRAAMPLCDHLGVVGLEVSMQRVQLAIAWRPELCTLGGTLHGGVLMTLADAAGATCAFLNLPEGSNGTTTVDAHSSFLGPSRGGRVVATATPVHVGTTTIVVAIDTADEGGRPLLRTTATQLVLR